MIKKVISATALVFVFAGCAPTQPTLSQNCFDKQRLEQREAKELREAKNSLSSFKAEYQDMSSHISFLNEYIADYSKYIGAASSASSVIKLMPIPYAGQISSAANFGGKMTVLVSNASRSMSILNTSIKTYEAKLALYEATPDSAKLIDAQKFANDTLLSDIKAAEQNLIKLRDGTASMLALSSAISQYYASTGEVLSQAASIFSKKEDAPKKALNDKALKAKNDGFEQKSQKIFNSFNEAREHIQSAAVIKELSGEL
jgi:cell fate (sporulation/competence/biofilm development) regulator YlbF (YheA/YmcA/DUF963 family)